jgi:hypothetical protein
MSGRKRLTRKASLSSFWALRSGRSPSANFFADGLASGRVAGEDADPVAVTVQRNGGRRNRVARIAGPRDRRGGIQLPALAHWRVAAKDCDPQRGEAAALKVR